MCSIPILSTNLSISYTIRKGRRKDLLKFHTKSQRSTSERKGLQILRNIVMKGSVLLQQIHIQVRLARIRGITIKGRLYHRKRHHKLVTHCHFSYQVTGGGSPEATLLADAYYLHVIWFDARTGDCIAFHYYTNNRNMNPGLCSCPQDKFF